MTAGEIRFDAGFCDPSLGLSITVSFKNSSCAREDQGKDGFLERATFLLVLIMTPPI